MTTLHPIFVGSQRVCLQGALPLDLIWAQMRVPSPLEASVDVARVEGDTAPGAWGPCGEAALLVPWEGPRLAADSGLLICWQFASPSASRSVTYRAQAGAPQHDPSSSIPYPLMSPGSLGTEVGDSSRKNFSPHRQRPPLLPHPLEKAQRQLALSSSHFQGID